MVQALATALKISDKKLNRALKCAKYVPPILSVSLGHNYTKIRKVVRTRPLPKHICRQVVMAHQRANYQTNPSTHYT